MAKLKIKERDILILDRMDKAENFFTRLKGLMGRELTEGEGLLIRPCNSIHTFFMKMEIDVIFVGKDDRVIQKIRSMKRGKVSPLVSGSKYVIEACPGAFDDVEIGDKLEIV